MWTRRTKSRPGALIATAQHSTAVHGTALHYAAPRGVVGAIHSTAYTREKLDFHWPEAVCVFLHAQAAFFPAFFPAFLVCLPARLLVLSFHFDFAILEFIVMLVKGTKIK
jgi:hypothetical protein